MYRQTTEIDGAAALVTGGNRGFGRALVDELLDRGAAKVYATARTPHAPRDERIVPLVLDVTDDRSVAAAAHAAPDVSIVVNNAGVSLKTALLDSPMDDIHRELETNLFGMIRVARAFAPVLARHDSSALVNVLSVLCGSRSAAAMASRRRRPGRRRTRCGCDCVTRGRP